MKNLTVILYGEQGNNCVLKLPDRKYPGVLIQGDTLKNILDTGATLVHLAKQQKNETLVAEAEGLFEMLKDIYDGYVKEVDVNPSPD